MRTAIVVALFGNAGRELILANDCFKVVDPK
jgi:hypothetical protein